MTNDNMDEIKSENQNQENLTDSEASMDDTKAEETIEIEAEEILNVDENENNVENVSNQNASQELNEVKDKYLRLYADFENFRRRVAKERTDLIKNAGEDLLKALLPVIDDFERAKKSIEKAETEGNTETPKEVVAIKEGIQLVHSKFVKILEQRGLKAMESSIGKIFNIDEHESITQIPAPTEDMKGKVIDEIEKGYYLHDKVLRFAKVVIGG